MVVQFIATIVDFSFSTALLGTIKRPCKADRAGPGGNDAELPESHHRLELRQARTGYHGRVRAEPVTRVCSFIAVAADATERQRLRRDS